MTTRPPDEAEREAFPVFRASAQDTVFQGSLPVELEGYGLSVAPCDHRGARMPALRQLAVSRC